MYQRRFKKAKHHTSIFLALVLAAMSLTGCSNADATETIQTAQNADEAKDNSTAALNENTDASQTTKDNADTVSTTETEKNTNDTINNTANGKGDDGSIRETLTALELSKLMGNGINLGNTLEAYGHIELGITADISAYETKWGQPVTTEEMLAGMKASGFDSIRIPIAWTNVMDFENGDYTIGSSYLDRVDELITYARNHDMYVIINDHWDGSWWGMFGSATESTREEAFTMYTSMWTQIANRYKDYSDYLIFESGNEELGSRLNDIDICKDSGSLSEDECYEMTNRINQTFVDTIRATGGNNEQRFLLIAGYNTDIEKTCDNRFEMPSDNAKSKLLVSVHYYTPWNYCGTDSGSQWGTIGDYEEQNNLFQQMTKFTEQGYGVIIGEYAVITKSDGSLKGNTKEYTENLLDNCDKYNYVPMLWDTSSFYLRSELKFVDEDLLALYQERRASAQADMDDAEIIAAATKRMENALAAAPAVFDSNINVEDLDGAIAWIMYNSRDWSIAYSSGDTYKPDDKAAGLVATDAVIDGEGTYTIGLDFTGTEAGFANGTAFSAIGISNAEVLYPNCVIDIKEVLVNGKAYELTAKPYTTSDNGICTRMNLYNEWVSTLPESARTADGNTTDAAATVVNNEDLTHIETLEITFDFIVP